jgi:predicted amidohydrolase YtcJ
MMTGFTDLERELTAYRLAAERGCKVRIRLYVVWSQVFGPRAMAAGRLREHREAMDPLRCRIAGVKVFADGALSSRTAAIRGAYEGETLSHGKTWSGKKNYRQDRLEQMLRTASEAGLQTAIHSLGDHATDCCLSALGLLDNPSMHRLEHAMMLDDAQIERIAALGVPVVQQPEFLVRFGEAYRRSVGPSRASGLNRYRSLLDAGVSLAFSSDRPVVPGRPGHGVHSAVMRPSEFDPAENLNWSEAEWAYTAAAADVGGDRGVFGRLESGEWADYQIHVTDAPDPEEVVLGSA